MKSLCDSDNEREAMAFITICTFITEDGKEFMYFIKSRK